jgi:hypothetical protein
MRSSTPKPHLRSIKRSWPIAYGLGDPALTDARSRPPPTSLSVVGIARRLTREIRRSACFGAVVGKQSQPHR